MCASPTSVASYPRPAPRAAWRDAQVSRGAGHDDTSDVLRSEQLLEIGLLERVAEVLVHERLGIVTLQLVGVLPFVGPLDEVMIGVLHPHDGRAGATGTIEQRVDPGDHAVSVVRRPVFPRCTSTISRAVFDRSIRVVMSDPSPDRPAQSPAQGREHDRTSSCCSAPTGLHVPLAPASSGRSASPSGVVSASKVNQYRRNRIHAACARRWALMREAALWSAPSGRYANSTGIIRARRVRGPPGRGRYPNVRGRRSGSRRPSRHAGAEISRQICSVLHRVRSLPCPV